MFSEVLNRGRLVVSGLFLTLGAALVAIGCALGTLGQLTLRDIAHVPHTAVSPVLNMAEHEKRGVDCIDCHQGVNKEDRAGMPSREFCMICHEVIEEQREKLALGGPIFDAEGRPVWRIAAALPEGTVFSHAKHTKTHDCTECHGDVGHGECDLSGLAAKFDNCRRCHRDEEASGNCVYCHGALDKGRLPHSHDDRWARTHGLRVRDMGGLGLVETTCNSCHSDSYCTKCHHEERPRDHTIFFIRAGHGLAADIDRERCAACHAEDRCVRCHLAGATPRQPGHPAVSNCISCHSWVRGHVFLTDNCLLCHR